MKALKIKMQCFFADGQFMWFMPEEICVLCKYDLKSGKIVSMYMPNGTMRSNAYGTIVKYKENLVLIPYGAEKIMIFNMNTEAFIQIALPKTKENYMKSSKFDYGFVKDRYIYLVPSKYPYILRVDMESYEILQSENLFAICRVFFGKPGAQVSFSASAWDQDNMLYIGVGVYDGIKTYSGIGRLELDTFKFDMVKLECTETWIKGMICYGNELFLYLGEGKIIELNQDMKTVMNIPDHILCDYENPVDMYIASVFMYEDKIVFIRKPKLDAVILDLRDGNAVSKMKLIDESVKYAGTMQNGLLLQPDNAGYFYIIEKECRIKNFFRIESEVIQNCFRKMMTSCESVFHENAVLQLPEWSRLVSDRDICALSGQNIGNTIYKNINKIL